MKVHSATHQGTREASFEPALAGGLSWQELRQNVGNNITVIRYTLEGGAWLPAHHDQVDNPAGYRDPAAILIGRLANLLRPNKDYSQARVEIHTDSSQIILPYNTPYAIWVDNVNPTPVNSTKAIQIADDTLDIGLEAYQFKLTTSCDYELRTKWLGQSALLPKA